MRCLFRFCIAWSWKFHKWNNRWELHQMSPCCVSTGWSVFYIIQCKWRSTTQLQREFFLYGNRPLNILNIRYEMIWVDMVWYGLIWFYLSQQHGLQYRQTWVAHPSHEEIRAKITDEEVQEWMKVRPLDFWGASPWIAGSMLGSEKSVGEDLNS
jgi:hypothetical protein